MDCVYQKPQFTDKELLDIFPEAENIIPQKIKEFEFILKGKEQEIQELLNEVYSLKIDSFSEWFAEEVIKCLFMPEIKLYDRRIIKLKRLQFLLNPNKRTGEINFQENIERARIYPIYELARDKLVLKNSGRNFVALCPFHNEKTPSFYLYTETNSFHCFGCQENGDVIKLSMALCGLDFKEAVSMLKN